MKKNLLCVILLLSAPGVWAQFNKGRILAGGSVNFSSNTLKDKNNNTTVTNEKVTSFSLNPNVGYFIIDNLAAGAGLRLSVSNSKGEGNNPDVKNTGVSIDPFVRYYLEPGIFFHGEFGVGSQKTKVTLGNVSTETNYTLTDWALGAGYAYFLSENVAIEPLLGFRSNVLANKDNDSKHLTSGLFLNVGLQVYLGNTN